MWSRENEMNAQKFCDAIRLMAKKPDNINNLENYLTEHFDIWLKCYGNSPEGIAMEMKTFAEMEF